MALLLATTGLVAVGLVGAEVAIERRRRRRLLRALATNPRMRAELETMRAMEESTTVPLLAVHVEGADLIPELAGARLQVCVKLGEPHHSLRQWTAKARCDPNGRVSFASSCVFPWRPSIQPVVRVRLAKLGIVDQVIAKEEFWLAFDDRGDLLPQGEQDVLLFDVRQQGQLGERKFLGQLRVVVQVQAISLGEMRRAGLLVGVPQDSCCGANPRVPDYYGPMGDLHVGGPTNGPSATQVAPNATVVHGVVVPPGVAGAGATGRLPEDRQPLVTGMPVTGLVTGAPGSKR